MSFYGYNAQAGVPDYSYIAKAGGQMADMIGKLPEVIEFDKAIKEARIGNNEIYESLKGELSQVEDDEFKNNFGMDKQTYLHVIRPGRNEKPDDYAARMTKAIQPYIGVLARKNVSTAQQKIGAIGSEQQVGMDLMKEGTFDDLESIGAIGPGPKATPEDVQRIGREQNVPMDKLTPELTEAVNRRSGQQLGQIPDKGTQIDAYKAIGGGATSEAEKAIGAMPTQYQDRNLGIQEQEIGVKQRAVGVDAAKVRQAGQKDNDELILKRIETLEQRKQDYQMKIADLENKTYTSFVAEPDELIKKQKELKKMRQVVDGIDENIESLKGGRSEKSKPSDEAYSLAEQFESEVYSKGQGYGTFKESPEYGPADANTILARKLVALANQSKLPINEEKIKLLLEKKEPLENIIEGILRMRKETYKGN